MKRARTENSEAGNQEATEMGKKRRGEPGNKDKERKREEKNK